VHRRRRGADNAATDGAERAKALWSEQDLVPPVPAAAVVATVVVGLALALRAPLGG